MSYKIFFVLSFIYGCNIQPTGAYVMYHMFVRPNDYTECQIQDGLNNIINELTVINGAQMILRFHSPTIVKNIKCEYKLVVSKERFASLGNAIMPATITTVSEKGHIYDVTQTVNKLMNTMWTCRVQAVYSNMEYIHTCSFNVKVVELVSSSSTTSTSTTPEPCVSPTEEEQDVPMEFVSTTEDYEAVTPEKRGTTSTTPQSEEAMEVTPKSTMTTISDDDSASHIKYPLWIIFCIILVVITLALICIMIVIKIRARSKKPTANPCRPRLAIPIEHQMEEPIYFELPETETNTTAETYTYVYEHTRHHRKHQRTQNKGK